VIKPVGRPPGPAAQPRQPSAPRVKSVLVLGWPALEAALAGVGIEPIQVGASFASAVRAADVVVVGSDGSSWDIGFRIGLAMGAERELLVQGESQHGSGLSRDPEAAALEVARRVGVSADEVRRRLLASMDPLELMRMAALARQVAPAK
jgi:hypothetical protein